MDLMLDPGMKPFVFFGALVVGLLLLEIFFMFVGVDTRLGGDGDTDFDLDVDADVDLEVELDVDTDFDAGELEVAGSESDLAPDVPGGGFIDLIGVKKLPMTIWLALFSAFFAGAGMAGQTMVSLIFSTLLPAGIAAAMVLPVALLLTGLFAEAVSNWIPREETSAISERSYGRRRGVITVGTARRGNPAQVRVVDGHGNLHYLMAEPVSDDDEIEQGIDVFIIRKRNGDLRLIRASE